MPIYLFTVTGHEPRISQIGLLPGIPQSLIADQTIGNIEQGSRLLLVLPNGQVVQTLLANYYVAIPLDLNKDPSTLPIIPVLPPEICASMVPIGTKVYIGGIQDA